MGLEHQLFFASAPKMNEIPISSITDPEIKVVVDCTQVVKANSRIRMRLAEAATISVFGPSKTEFHFSVGIGPIPVVL